MIKNNLDFKLINIAIITIIAYLLYQMSEIWLSVISITTTVLLPFLLAFILAYALHPILKYLEIKRVPKGLGIMIIVIGLISILTVVGILVVPLLVEQLSNLFNNIIIFIRELSTNYNINVGPVQETLNTVFNNTIIAISKYVSNGAINIVNISFSVISTLLISLSVSIYFLMDMDKIRSKSKKYLLKKKKRLYKYLVVLDNEMNNYLLAFIKIMIITFVEYLVIYLLIKHPNALLIAFLAAIANLIPFFGAITVNILAAVTAAVNLPFPGLLINTGIAIFLLSIVDTYITNPLVYKKSNRVHPIIVILSVFAGGYLAGFMGIILSLPVAIIIITTYKFFRTDIYTRINNMKNQKN